jgi:multiple sugar transport system substrate-binding protein
LYGGPVNVGRPSTADYKTATVNDPDWVAAIQWYSDAMWKDHIMADSTAISAIDPANGDPFAVGGVAMWDCHTWYLSESLNELTFKWDIAPVPFNLKGERIARVDADVFGIPSAAKNKDAAWEVMKWLLLPENNLELCDIYGCMPARKSTEAQYKASLAEKYPGVDLDVIFQAANFLDVPNHESWVPEYGRVNEVLANALSTLMTADQEHDAKTLLDQANKDIQAIFDEYWANH